MTLVAIRNDNCHAWSQPARWPASGGRVLGGGHSAPHLDRWAGLYCAPHGARSQPMIDWDDVRYFLSVAREGSVRAAAERLKVNHSTVLRRIAQLEERLGAHMFEKLPSGYRLTDAGEEILELAV